ncbi:MAG: NYN domain-containing protein, partial [Candidatus Staskawiczbacteria bacterium]|nr:NYN domain-containing protein [Candidatus Staskawiczbacteria bacterium]
CSGDGDFIALVEYLKNMGKRVEVVAFGRSTSGKLKESADEFIDLDEAVEKFLLKK